jgi:hypothetical protein
VSAMAVKSRPLDEDGDLLAYILGRGIGVVGVEIGTDRTSQTSPSVAVCFLVLSSLRTRS